MASTSPSPTSSAVTPPTSPPADSTPPPSPPSSQPDQTSDSPTPPAPSNTTSSSPPPQSPTPADPPPLPPPPTSASPPPSPPASPPPSIPASPPPSTPASPPPSTTTSPPPTTPASSAPPPSPPASPPPTTPTTSVPPPASPTPLVASSPPLSGGSSSPPPSGGSSSPPPEDSPTPPVAKTSPPPSQPVQLSPPPPATVPTPPSSNSPPAPAADSPKNPPPLPEAPSPPSPSGSGSSPPPETTLPSPPPPSVPSSSLPSPPTSNPASKSNSTTSASSAPLPAIPTQKPTAKSTNESDVTANGSSKDGLQTGGAIAIAVIVGFVVLSLVVMAMWFVRKKKRRDRLNVGYGIGMPSPFASSQNSDSVFLRPYSPAPPHRVASGSGSDFMYAPSEGGVSNSKSWFTYEELVQATNGFSTENLLGEGGFGCVYKGILADGREVAVKQLKIGGGQGEREFRAEVEIISRVHHRHLVSLVGYCISEHQRLLVYDYVPNNTLHYHLHGEGRPVMDWAIRVKVAAGSARGIAYLHEDCHPRIIHRDIKSSNILLDNNYEAQVSDFGLAKLALDSNTHITTRVMGTFGYMAPEYATSGKLTEKSDVYSFGVVLLELITGRKPVDASQPLGDESLVEWARPLLSQALDTEDFGELVDPRLGLNFNENEMFRMVEAAAACVRHSAAKRPRMGQVVRALDSMDEISDLSNGMRPGQSEVFDPALQSAQIRMFQRMAFGSQEYSTEFFERTHNSWGSRDHRDRTQSSFGSRENRVQPQRSWTSREQDDQGATININRSGFWNN